MSSVNFDPSVGGDGSTVSDDSNASTGLANYGWKTRFVPALAQLVAVAGWVKTRALDVSAYASAAASYAVTSTSNAETAIAKAIEAGGYASSATTSAGQAVAARDLAIAAWGASTAPTESLAAISQSVHYGAIVASFLYDTSKDSDAGQWRKRCADKSWYTEAIQTGAWRGQRASLAAAWAVAGAAVGDWYQSTADGLFYAIGGTVGAPTQTQIYRGGAREFPALALIVAQASRVVIYDASAPGCPMWRSFPSSSVLTYGGASGIKCLHSTQGVVLIGSINGLFYFDFVRDFVDFQQAGSYRTNGSMASVWTLQMVPKPGVYIANDTTNAVAATVLPDAPIDPATGLAVPTIAVATAGGVSVIKHDGTVVNSAATADRMYGLSIDLQSRIWVSGWDSGNLYEYPRIGTLSSAFVAIKQYSLGSIPSTITSMGPNVKTVGTRRGVVGGFASGVSYFKDNPATPGNGMVSNVTKDYNSGWMVGDIRRALLADTVAETVAGSTLITGDSSTFIGGVGSWVSSATFPSTAAAVGGELQVTFTSAFGRQVLAIPCVVGKSYVLVGSARVISGAGFATLGVSSASNGASMLSAAPYAIRTASTTAVSGSTTFVATATTMYAVCGDDAAINGATYAFDNITCQLAEPDRSVKNKGITVVGSLTKSPVAAGAALVAYSGFSASNYLEEAYSADLDFGTGDFCVMGWANVTSVATTQYLYDRGQTGSNPRLSIAIFATRYYLCCSATGVGLDTGVSASVGLHFLEMHRLSGVLYFYLDGALVYSGVNTSNITNTSAASRVGQSFEGTAPFLSTMALWRIGATAPSADQIAHIYRTERPLVAPGAQCTLAGTSNAITALAYDEDTDTWHAGTSWGRTGFRDLLRVDSEAATVGAVTSISAAQGAVLMGGASSAKFYQPAFLLRDEIRRRKEARAALGKEPVFFDFDAVTSQTAFTVQQGFAVKAVYSAGTLKRLGGTKDYTVATDGFRETVTFGTAPGNAVWVSILCVRA